MITMQQIEAWLKDPSAVNECSEHDLRELILHFPYCEILHWAYLKKLHDTDDVRFDKQLEAASIYISNRIALYNYLIGVPAGSQPLPDVQQLGGVASDYFTLMENGNHKASLQELAANLKAARLAKAKEAQAIKEAVKEPTVEVKRSEPFVPKEAPKRTPIFTPDAFVELPCMDITEENAIKCIKEHKYSEALQILEELNLRKPKKNTYFAIQIKYLKTIIENNK